MDVQNEIKIYSIDGKDTVVGEKTKLFVRSIWNKNKLVELQIGDGAAITVHESDLIKAISNATDNER